jgi:hypothetical protein
MLPNRRPPVPSLITTLGGNIVAVLFQMPIAAQLRIRHAHDRSITGQSFHPAKNQVRINKVSRPWRARNDPIGPIFSLPRAPHGAGDCT